MREQLPALLRQWKPAIGEHATECCIWLNLELIKKPFTCLEYIPGHEMIHMPEKSHTERFCDLLDDFLPDWRLRRDELNRPPLGHYGFA